MKSTKPFLKRYLEKLPLRLILLLMLFGGAIFLFVFVIHEVLWEQEDEADQSVFTFLAMYITDERTEFMKTVTHFASATFLQIAYGVLVLCYLVAKNWKRALEISVIGIGGFIVNYFMKISFERIRPPHPLIERLNNFSFPSGHATSAFIFYGLLAYLLWKTEISRVYKVFIGTLLVLFSLLIGFSRIYLRVHYPSDVVAGICIGFAWLLLTIWLFEHLKKKADKEMHNKRIRSIK